MMSSLVLISFALGTSALNFVTYPTKVVIKSCKLVPCMLVAYALNGKLFSSTEYIAAFCMSFAAAGFALGDASADDSKSHILGVLMLLGAIVCDAITPNVQEKIMSANRKVSVSEMMQWTNGIGCINFVIIAGADGELQRALKFSKENPTVIPKLVVLGALSFAGVNVYMNLIKMYSAPVGVLVTTIRKIFTMMFSFVIFPKAWSRYYYASFFLLGVGTYLQLEAKRVIQTRMWLPWTRKRKTCTLHMV